MLVGRLQDLSFKHRSIPTGIFSSWLGCDMMLEIADDGYFHRRKGMLVVRDAPQLPQVL